MLPPRDSGLLGWFFSHGVSTFERSTFGAALERAELYATPWQRPKTITARPTRELASHGGVEPDGAVLAKYGAASRQLGRVAAVDPLAAQVLEAFFGDVGASWAGHERGRITSLFPFTPSGRQLVVRSRKRSKGATLQESDRDRLRTEIEIDRLQPRADPTRRTLIARATIEATELLERATRAWLRSAKT